MAQGNTGSVTVRSVIEAYLHGYFPMADENGTIEFCAYDPRGIIPLDDAFIVRKSLRQIIRRNEFEIRYDTNPAEVLSACSRENIVSRDEIWLSRELMDIYLKLFDAGVLHTVEVWSKGEDAALLGGLYGLHFGSAFCGESMFSRAPYASQIALVYLVERLRQQGFALLDAQMSSEHLKQFGLREVTQAEYMKLFTLALARSVSF